MNCSLLNQILSSTVASTPASNRTGKNSNNGDDDIDNASSSYFQTTVCLYDWWLIKADEDFQGKRLAVAGFTSRELQAMRVFTSAPIVKRYDVFTLETADGICIVIKGFINKLRTIENGFPSEVFSHFVFGFPPCWEAYSEKCLGKECTTATGSTAFPDLNKSASVPELSAVGGISNSIPIRTTSKHSENASDRITTNASRGRDSPNRTAECNNIEKTKNYTLENLRPSISCDVNNISSTEDNLAVPAEPSSYHVVESFKRMDNLKSCTKDDKGTVRKSKTKVSESFESITILNAASGESPVSKNSVYSLIPSNLGPVVSRGNSGVELMATSSSPRTSEKQKENNINEDMVDCRNKNCSNVCLSQDSKVIVRCTGEKLSGVESSNFLSSGLGVGHNDSLSAPPICGRPNVPDLSGNCTDDTTIFPVLHSAMSINSVTPSEVDINKENITPSNSGSRKTRNCLRNLESNQRENSGFRGFVKCKCKELMSEASEVLDGENLKRCSSQGSIHSLRKIDVLGAIQSQSVGGIFKNLLENLKDKEKERRTITCGLKAKRNQMNSVLLISYMPSEIVQNDTSECMNVFNLHDDDLQEPISNTVIKDNSKQRQDCRKLSQTETPRQKLNNLARSPSGLGDTNYQHDLRTAVGEKGKNAKEVLLSGKKIRRKINFDTHASPCTVEGKEKVSIISPDSLSLKRSRSGRLLLPSLEFWRNQIAVYDADRKITGIQEAVDDVTPSKGSKSEPRKKLGR